MNNHWLNSIFNGATKQAREWPAWMQQLRQQATHEADEMERVSKLGKEVLSEVQTIVNEKEIEIKRLVRFIREISEHRKTPFEIRGRCYELLFKYCVHYPLGTKDSVQCSGKTGVHWVDTLQGDVVSVYYCEAHAPKD